MCVCVCLCASSSLADSREFPDFFSQSVYIPCRSKNVLHTVSSVCTDSINVSF